MPELLNKPKDYMSNMSLKQESKKLISMIKSNMKKKEEAELELLEAGGMKHKLTKFDNKVKKRLKESKEV